MTLIAVLDYGIGNLRSAQKAFEHVGADARLTADAAMVRDAAGVVLPGVGAFGRCMAALTATGLSELSLEVIESGKPFLGICVGMQLLYESSDESPGVAGLGVLPGNIEALPAGVKRPQMQWNILDVIRPSQLFDGLDSPIWVYFVHSFAAEASDDTVAVCDYGGPVVAAAVRDNVSAVQFHPEKSGPTGLTVLRNFVAMAAREAAAA